LLGFVLLTYRHAVHVSHSPLADFGRGVSCSDVSIHRFFISIMPVAPKFTAASRGTPCDSVASC